jgi:hypothetical protein
MNIFNWFRKTVKKHDSECLRFMKGLTDNEKPVINFTQYWGYYYRWNLQYTDVTIELSYNSIRKKWQLHISDNKTFKAIYGYYIEWRPPSKEEVHFLLDTYKLTENLMKCIAENKAKEINDKLSIQILKDRYL